jgi:hypothetical protein
MYCIVNDLTPDPLLEGEGEGLSVIIYTAGLVENLLRRRSDRKGTTMAQ